MVQVELESVEMEQIREPEKASVTACSSWLSAIFLNVWVIKLRKWDEWGTDMFIAIHL